MLNVTPQQKHIEQYVGPATMGKDAEQSTRPTTKQGRADHTQENNNE